MAALPGDELRALVREVVREAVAAAVPPTPAPPAATQAARPVATEFGATPSGPLAADERCRTDDVRITNDRELDAFVRKLLVLFDNPKARADIKAGRLRFALTGGTRTGASTATARRIERGAVTEQMVAEIALNGGGLILGKRAVLTPLAREKARALGVSIEKERT
jgi:hypothetical protein